MLRTRATLSWPTLYLWILSMTLVSCHLSGDYNCTVAPRIFLRNLCTPGLVVMFFLDEKVFSRFCWSVTRASCSHVLISTWRNLPSDRQHDTTTALTYVIRSRLLFPRNYQTRRLFSLNTITQTMPFSLQVPLRWYPYHQIVTTPSIAT
jgi:hypothetical protein